MKKYILELKLIGAEIARKISISDNMSFSELHDIIQIIFGWGNSHLHHFRIGNLVIGDYDNENEIPDNYIYEKEARLSTVLSDKPDVLYEYDFGDSWQISINVLEAQELEKGSCLPEVIETYGTMLVDDCGGVEKLKSLSLITPNIENLNFLLKQHYYTK